MREGDVIAGRYRLETLLGAGGMGVVWLATDTELRRQVAVKQASTGDIRREARIGAGLQHPNVVAVYDVVVEDNVRWLVTEYLPSRSLAQILREDGPLPRDDAARIGAHLAGALKALHARGIVHRDITPGNVLVGTDGTAKLSDLGIAMWAHVTVTGGAQSPGTPGYVAPEVRAGHASSAASDMYALGATLQAAIDVDTGAASRLGTVLSALRDPDPRRRPSAARVEEMLLEVAAGRKSFRLIRKRLLVTAGAVAVALLAAGIVVWRPFASDSAAPDGASAGMPAITVSGSKIQRGGQDWWLAGYNSFIWGGCADADKVMSAAQVDAWFASMRHDGHGGVRLYFFEGWNIDRLDAAVASAKRHNIYLTITLDSALGECGTSEKTQAWFKDQRARAVFQQHMVSLLQRYKGENAIAWFEYFNQPGGDHTWKDLRDFYDAMGDVAAGIDPQRLFSTGVSEPEVLDGEGNFRVVSEARGVDIVSLHEFEENEVISSHYATVRDKLGR